MRDFVIRKSLTKNAITAMPAWKSDERFLTNAEIVFELLKQETVTTPLVLPTYLVKIKSLVFHYPAVSIVKSESESMLPMPDLVSAPKMLVPISLEKEEIIRQVLEQFVRLSQEMYTANSSPAEGNDK